MQDCAAATYCVSIVQGGQPAGGHKAPPPVAAAATWHCRRGVGHGLGQRLLARLVQPVGACASRQELACCACGPAGRKGGRQPAGCGAGRHGSLLGSSGAAKSGEFCERRRIKAAQPPMGLPPLPLLPAERRLSCVLHRCIGSSMVRARMLPIIHPCSSRLELCTLKLLHLTFYIRKLAAPDAAEAQSLPLVWLAHLISGPSCWAILKDW